VLNRTKIFDTVVISLLDAVTAKIIIKAYQLFLTVDFMTTDSEGVLVMLTVIAIITTGTVIVMGLLHCSPLEMSSITHHTETEMMKMTRNLLSIEDLHHVIDLAQQKTPLLLSKNIGLTHMTASLPAQAAVTDQRVEVPTELTVLHRSKSRVRINGANNSSMSQSTLVSAWKSPLLLVSRVHLTVMFHPIARMHQVLVSRVRSAISQRQVSQL